MPRSLAVNYFKCGTKNDSDGVKNLKPDTKPCQ